MNRSVTCCACLLATSFCVGGCLDSMAKGGRAPGQGAVVAAPWPFAPASMRVSPFTNIGFDEERNTVVLNLMVELRDRIGDLTKGVGDFRVELRDLSGGGEEGQLLYSWIAPMRTVDQNVQHYSSTLSAYHLMLAMDSAPDPSRRMKVAVQFTDLGGRRLHADGEIGPEADRPRVN